MYEFKGEAGQTVTQLVTSRFGQRFRKKITNGYAKNINNLVTNIRKIRRRSYEKRSHFEKVYEKWIKPIIKRGP